MSIGGELAPHGYPDWQPVRSVADIRLLDVAAVVAPQTYGPFFVGNYPGLGVLLSSTVPRVSLTVTYYQTAALTGVLGVQSVRVNPQSFFNGSFSILGPYASVTVSNESGGGVGFALTLALHQHLGNIQQSPEANVLAAKTPVNIANGATNTLQAPQVWPGWATFTWHTAAGSPFSYFIEHLDSAGAWNAHEVISATTAEAPFSLLLPASPVRVRVLNNSGAAADFYYSLVGEPHFIRR